MIETKMDGVKCRAILLISLALVLIGQAQARAQNAAQDAAQDAAQGDVFDSEAYFDARSNRHYHWLALEQYAQESARTGFLGRADVLFQEALKEVYSDQSTLKYHPEMLAQTLSDQGFFYHRQLKDLTKARESYERSLSIFRKELTAEWIPYPPPPSHIWLAPRRAVTEGEVQVLRRYAELLKELHLEDAALKATNEADQTAAKANPARLSSNGEDIDFGPYMARLQESISWNWCPIRSKPYATVITFKIMKDGSVQNIGIQKSAFHAADQAAIEAINAAAPFDQLPDFKGASDNVDIRFTFNYLAIFATTSAPGKADANAISPAKVKGSGTTGSALSKPHLR